MEWIVLKSNDETGLPVALDLARTKGGNARETKKISWLSWPLAPWRLTFVQAQSPYESSADFAKYAMKLRAQALLKVEPQVFVPTTSRFSSSRYPWKTDIVTTIFWIGEMPTANNPGSESQELVGLALGAQLRRLRQPRSVTATRLYPGQFRPAAEPVLLRIALQRCVAWAVQTRSADRCAVVSAGLRAAGSFGLQRSLGRDPSRQPGLLRAMGRLRSVSHRSLPIRFPERTAAAEPEPRCRARCLAGGARLSWARADVPNRLAICRSARCPPRAVAKLRRQ